MFNAGDVVVIDFPGVTGTKRRPAVILSSPAYHTSRPDVIVGLITSRSVPTGLTDYVLEDWPKAGLRLASTFRSFLVTLPPAAHPVVVGRLSDRDWEGVRACVKAALVAL